MKILYISCHSILEHDELQLFTELGHECFSLGAYIKPEGHYLLPRPAIQGMKPHPEFEQFAVEFPKNHLAQELIDWADVLIWMHNPIPLIDNWDRVKHKINVFRGIGQETPAVENTIRRARYEGLKIVRMSPKSENIIGYCGADAMIRFYEDPEEWKDWNGKEKRVINFTQSLKGRRQHCHYDSIMQIIESFPTLIYGPGNEDLGPLNGGELPYELMKGALRDNRIFIYAGTWPSPYTLAFTEALMTGIPIVAIGKKLAEEIVPEPDRIDYYEISDIIQNEKNGFISDNINELRGYVDQLLQDGELAKRISAEGRKTAIRLFGKDKIRNEWENFLKSL